MRISDWSSDVCSSDLVVIDDREPHPARARRVARQRLDREPRLARLARFGGRRDERGRFLLLGFAEGVKLGGKCRSEEHTSELQSLMRISYAVFCLKKTRK